MPNVTFAAAPWAGWLLAWLGTYLLQGTVLLGAAWAASRVVRSPGVRDALWKTAVAGSLVTATWFVVTARAPAPAAALRREIPLRESSPFVLRTHIAERGPVVPPWTREIALGLWLAGAAASLARLELGRRRYWRAAGARHAVADAEAADALRRLRETAGVERTIYLTAADGLRAPAAVGLAEICLPAAALDALTPAQRESVIAHELGHLLRRDPLWKVAVEIAAAVFWFQPLLRVARRELAECAELLCDGFSVRVTGRRRPLVESLGVLAAAFRPCGVAAAGFGDSGSPLLRRAERVMDASRAPARPLPAMVRAALALAALAGTLAFSPGVAPPRPNPYLARRALMLDGAELDAARGVVARVEPGGFVRLTEDRAGMHRELVARRGADGQPAYEYSENGAARPFDVRARSWLADALNGR